MNDKKQPDDIPTLEETLNQMIAHQRPHGFFAPIGSVAKGVSAEDKAITEVGIAKIFLEAHRELGLKLPFFDPESFENDPPDCIGKNSIGQRSVAIEITELVNQKAIEMEMGARRDNTVTINDYLYEDWDEDILKIKIPEIINNKDKKKFNGKKYSDIILIIHTDEHFIIENARCEINNLQDITTEKITKAYILFSYNPIYTPSYQFIEIKIKNSNR